MTSGGITRLLLVGFGAVASLASTSTTAKRPARSDLEHLFNVASFDLNCAELSVRPVGNYQRKVTGCGQEKTYKLSCPKGDYEYDSYTQRDPAACSWIWVQETAGKVRPGASESGNDEVQVRSPAPDPTEAEEPAPAADTTETNQK